MNNLERVLQVGASVEIKFKFRDELNLRINDWHKLRIENDTFMLLQKWIKMPKTPFRFQSAMHHLDQ